MAEHGADGIVGEVDRSPAGEAVDIKRSTQMASRKRSSMKELNRLKC
jgi:hypothetical protein